MPEFSGRDVSVVIPTRDRWSILRQTLQALETQTVDGIETIVVIDGEDQHPPGLGDARVITKKHGGPGAARNIGARSTDRRLLLFLGDDMIPVPKLVEQHLELHNSHLEPGVAVLGHIDIHPDVRRHRLNRWMEWSGTQFDYRNITQAEAGFGRFYSSNVSLKRDFFLGAGGFDEDFTYYYEDLDCGWRLHNKGLRLLYQPSAVARHFHPLSWEDVVRRFEGVARGERLMSTKHPWFDAYFANRVHAASRRPPVSKIWPLIVDYVPSSLRRLRRAAERRADAWYYQRLGPHFLNAWHKAVDVDELQDRLGNR